MFRSGHVIVALMLCICAVNWLDKFSGVHKCFATVLERDWRSPGDGLLTFDDVNQREWLDLSASTMAQFPAPRLENALAQLQAGGLFADFTFAKRGDVLELALSAGIDPNTDSYARNASATRSLIELLSPTPPFTGEVLHSIGIVDEIPGPPFFPLNQSSDFRFDPNSGPEGRAGVAIFPGNDLAALRAVGLMLYRNVPEPGGIVLALLGVTFGYARRAREK